MDDDGTSLDRICGYAILFFVRVITSGFAPNNASALNLDSQKTILGLRGKNRDESIQSAMDRQ